VPADLVKCGDVDREDDIDQDDMGSPCLLRLYNLRSPETARTAAKRTIGGSTSTFFELSRCSVKGGERDCDLVDAVLLRREKAGLGAPKEDVCQTKILDVAP